MYPKWNNTLSSKLILGFLILLLDNAKVDYKDLESTFGVPKSSPDPPGKGSTKCHLGLRNRLAIAGKPVLINARRGIRSADAERILLPPHSAIFELMCFPMLFAPGVPSPGPPDAFNPDFRTWCPITWTT